MNLAPNRAEDVEGQMNLSPAQSHEEITHPHSDVTGITQSIMHLNTEAVNNAEESMYPVHQLHTQQLVEANILITDNDLPTDDTILANDVAVSTEDITDIGVDL